MTPSTIRKETGAMIRPKAGHVCRWVAVCYGRPVAGYYEAGRWVPVCSVCRKSILDTNRELRTREH